MREVVLRNQAAFALHFGGEITGRLAAIKFAGAVLSYAPQRGGQLRLSENFAGLIIGAVLQENPAGGRELNEDRFHRAERSSEFLVDQKSIFSETNRRGHRVSETDRAEGLESERKSRDSAGNGGRSISDERGLRINSSAGFHIHIARGFRGRHLAIVNESRAAISEPDKHKAAASNITRLGIHDGESESDSNSCINGVASPLHDFGTYFRSELFVADHHRFRTTHGLGRPVKMPGIGRRWRLRILGCGGS